MPLAAVGLLALVGAPRHTLGQSAPASGAAADRNVYNWRSAPPGAKINITRVVFDLNGYQLYGPDNVTIVVPFASQNFNVMKFGRSTTGQTYFVNDDTAPILCLTGDFALENAAVQDARWYPLTPKFAIEQPVYVNFAGTWEQFVGMGWYPATKVHGGSWGLLPNAHYAMMTGYGIQTGERFYTTFDAYYLHYIQTPGYAQMRAVYNNYATPATGAWIAAYSKGYTPKAAAPAATGTVTDQTVYHWRDVPPGLKVPVKATHFDLGGYQVYGQAGETIDIPFKGQNLNVLKFAPSKSGESYFVADDTAPTLYLSNADYLQNSAIEGARWYPLAANDTASAPSYVSLAPNWNQLANMDWYPNTNMDVVSGYQTVNGGSVAGPGYSISVNGTSFSTAAAYNAYVTAHPGAVKTRVVYIYKYVGISARTLWLLRHSRTKQSPAGNAAPTRGASGSAASPTPGASGNGASQGTIGSGGFGGGGFGGGFGGRHPQKNPAPRRPAPRPNKPAKSGKR